jgi:hypothetical protein
MWPWEHIRLYNPVISSSNSTHQLAASIALHGLSLAIPGKVVGATALIAGGSSGVSTKSTPVRSIKTSTRSRSTTGSSLHVRVRAIALDAKIVRDDEPLRVQILSTYSKMTRLVAVVAATAWSTTVQTQCRTVSLDMAQTLAVIALLG